MKSISIYSCVLTALLSASYISCEEQRMKTKVTAPVQVGLKVVLDNINLPTVIKTAILPGDKHESLIVLTQPGEILVLRKGKMQKVLDLSFATGGPIVKLGNVSGDVTYDERGLLGIEFHPDFTTNGRFFLYYSTQDNTQKLRELVDSPDPCNPKTITHAWTDESKYSHVNVVEEWKWNTIADIKRVRRLLSIKHPFFNHSSINNLFWSEEFDKLLLLTGDGGFRDGPFNLSQNDKYFHGKVIALNLNSPVWRTYKSQPVARFAELPPRVRRQVETLIKGVRNWSGLTEFRSIKDERSIKFVGQPGQDFVEAVFAFKKFYTRDKYGKKRPLNFGWRAFEGSWPTTHYRDCTTNTPSPRASHLLGVTYPQEAVALNVERRIPYFEYFHQDKRPGKVEGVCITAQQVYRGNALKGLKNHLIVSDWAQNSGAAFPTGMPISLGFLIHVPIDHKLTKLHDYEKIDIAYDFKKPAFFVSLGANKRQTRVFLGTYETAGTTTPGLGTVFELVPAP